MKVRDIRPDPEFTPKLDGPGLDSLIERLAQKSADVIKARIARAANADEHSPADDYPAAPSQ